MASISKRGEWRQARVHRKGYGAVVQTVYRKADAQKWARNTEAQLDLGSFASKRVMPRLKLMVERYASEVTPTKKGALQ
jgi:hypothetical protein